MFVNNVHWLFTMIDEWLFTIYCVREKIGDCSMYISIYEIVDVDSGYVANVLLSLVHDDKCFMSYLLTREELSKCNYQIVGILFSNTLNIVWPNGIKYNNFIFLTDAVLCMVKAVDPLLCFQIWYMWLVEPLNYTEWAWNNKTRVIEHHNL